MPADTSLILSPRAKRRWVTRAGIVAAAVFVMFLVLWTKSFWKGNGVGYTSYSYPDPQTAQRFIHDAELISGSIIIGSEQRTVSRPPKQQERGLYVYSPQPRYAYVNWMPRQSIWNKLGFFVMTDPGGANASLRRVIVPGWFVLLLSGSLAATLLHRAWRGWLRMTRQMRGECPHCGYDLCASPQRCPECGALRVATAVGPRA
jgi:hypothetical protein